MWLVLGCVNLIGIAEQCQLIPVLKRLRQTDLYEFKKNQGYTVRPYFKKEKREDSCVQPGEQSESSNSSIASACRSCQKGKLNKLFPPQVASSHTLLVGGEVMACA